MKRSVPTCASIGRIALLILATMGISRLGVESAYSAEPKETAPAQPREPWSATDLIDPSTLAKAIDQDAKGKPIVLCVGVAALYRSAHIVGAKYAGPASSSEGINLLENAVRDLPHDRAIVIYCGCCPWKDCPNIRPAFAFLRKSGFQHVHVLTLPTNFHHDWTDQGYAVEKGEKLH